MVMGGFGSKFGSMTLGIIGLVVFLGEFVVSW